MSDKVGDSRRYHPWTLYFGASWSLLAALIMIYIWWKNPWIRNLFFNTTVVICSLGIWQFFWIVLPEACWLEGFGEYSVAVFDTLLTAFFTYLSFRFVWDLTSNVPSNNTGTATNNSNNNNDRISELAFKRIQSGSEFEVRSDATETGGSNNKSSKDDSTENSHDYRQYETPDDEETGSPAGNLSSNTPKEIPTSVQGEGHTEFPAVLRRNTTTQMLANLNLHNVVGNLDFEFKLTQTEWYIWFAFSVCWFLGFVVTATASNLYGDWTPWCMIYDVEYRVILYHGQAYALATYLIFMLGISTYRVSQSQSASDSWQWKAQRQYMIALIIRVILKFVSVWRCTAILIDPMSEKADKNNRNHCALQCKLIGFFTPFVLSTIPAGSWLRIHYDIWPVLFGFSAMDENDTAQNQRNNALA